MARTLQDAGITMGDIGLRRPTLDEVFLHLTGRPAAPDAGDRDGGVQDGEVREGQDGAAAHDPATKEGVSA